MTKCDRNVIPMRPEPVCPSRPGHGFCGSGRRVWVLAASEGMAALYEKEENGALTPLPPEPENAALMRDLQGTLQEAATSGALSQLVLVGGPGDISWMLLSLPEAVAGKVVAEIKYPLLSEWFRQKRDTQRLLHALENALAP